MEYLEEVARLEREEWGTSSSKPLQEKIEMIKDNLNNSYFEKLILPYALSWVVQD